MPSSGGPVTRATVAPFECAAAEVPFLPRWIVQFLLPTPEAAVTIMISESTIMAKVVGRPAIGKGVEELTVRDVTELLMPPPTLSVVENAVLVKSDDEL